jgi:hypothetical protein
MKRSIACVLAALLAAPVLAHAGQQSGLLYAVTISDYDVGPIRKTVLLINFVGGTPYSGGVNPGCNHVTDGSWAYDLSTEKGRQAADTARLGRARGRRGRRGGDGTGAGGNADNEDGNIITMFQ